MNAKNNESQKREDVETQIRRVEDLLKFYIQKRKEQLQFYIDLGQESLSRVEFMRKTFVSAFVGLIFIIIGLTAIQKIETDSAVYVVIGLIIFTVFIHWLFLRNHRKTAEYFGEAMGALDQCITNHKTVLELLLVGSLDSFQGNKKVIHEIGTFVIILEHLNTLYMIKPWEKLAKIYVISDGTKKTLSSYSKLLKENLKFTLDEYEKLDKNLIPQDLQNISQTILDEHKKLTKSA